TQASSRAAAQRRRIISLSARAGPRCRGGRSGSMLLDAHLHTFAGRLPPLSNVGSPLVAHLASIRPDPTSATAPIGAPLHLRKDPEFTARFNAHLSAFAFDVAGPLRRLARFARSPQIDRAARLVP